MSRTIDERVVEMRFDNRQFEQATRTSMSTLEKLKRSLNLDGAARGLENVASAAKSCDMTGLSGAVEAVRVKFSAMEVMAVTALSNITNSAVNAGIQLAKSLSVDNISAGWTKFGQKTTSVGTLISQGYDLATVEAQLERLNWFTDETSYNFTDMVANIAKFTATGKALEPSVTALEGIANWAALSGQNASTASHAMYQLSQAMGAGVMRKEDYKSIQNVSMDTDEFRQKALDAAVALGTLKQNVDGTYESLMNNQGAFNKSQFAEHLTQDAWFTSDVMMKVFNDYSGAVDQIYDYANKKGITASQAIEELGDSVDQFGLKAFQAAQEARTWGDVVDSVKDAVSTGWMNTFELIFGNYEEAKALWTDLANGLYDVFAESGNARNEMLSEAMTSGWTQFLGEGISDANSFKETILTVARDHGIAVDKMIEANGSFEESLHEGWLTADILTESLNEFTEHTKNLSEEERENLGVTQQQIDALEELNRSVKDGTVDVEGYADSIGRLSGRENLLRGFWNTWEGIGSVVAPVKEAFREIFPAATADQVYAFTEHLRVLTEKFKIGDETADKLKRTFKGLFSIIDIGKQTIESISKPFWNFLSGGAASSFAGAMLSVTASFGDFFTELNEGLKNGNTLSVISDTLSGALNRIGDAGSGLWGVLGGLGGLFSDVFGEITRAISNAVRWITENISGGDIFTGLAGGGLFMLLKNLAGLVGKVKDVLEGFGKSDSKATKFSDILEAVHGSLESFQQGIKVASLVGIAGAVAVLSSAVRKLSEIDAVSLAKALTATQIIFLELNSGVKTLTKTLSGSSAKGTITASIAMIAMAAAVRLLASAMEKIGALPLKSIMKGLVGIGGALLELSVAVRVMGTDGVPLRTSIAVLALAESCVMLSNALQSFGAMQWDEIGRGLAAMGGALIEFVPVIVVMNKVGSGKAILGAAALLIAVQSLDEISENLERLGTLSWGKIGRGLTAMGGALGEFAAVLSIMGAVGGGSVLLSGAGLLVAVQSLDEISENLERLGSLSWAQIGRGLAAMGIALGEFTVALSVMGAVGGISTLFGGAALLVAVQSLDEISENLERLGNLSWDQIGRGLAVMGGALGELGGIAGLLGKLTGIGGLLGAGAILIGVQGLGELADALQKFGSMTWSEIGRGLTAMGAALTELAVVTGLLGTLAPLGALVGSGALLLSIQGLDDLANVLQKFGGMSWDEIGRGLAAMGTALGEVALGGLANTFSGLGASAISTVAAPLGELADSVKKWATVSVPEDLGTKLGSLADGVFQFTFGGMGASAIGTAAAPLGTLADSVRKWVGVYIPISLGDQLSALASGVEKFTFGGLGASALSTAAPGIGEMANAVKKWTGVSIPKDLQTTLSGLAAGVEAFSFAFLGGWSIDALTEPLASLAGTVKKWNGVSVPTNIQEGLKSLADGVSAFNFAFLGAWTLDGIVGPISDLAEAVKKWNGVSLVGVSSELTAFSESLKNLGQLSIANMVQEFQNSTEKIYQAIANVSGTMISAVNSNKPSVLAAFKAMITESLIGIRQKNQEFSVAGQEFVRVLVNGIKARNMDAPAAFKNIIERVLDVFIASEPHFFSAAEEIVRKFANGIEVSAHLASVFSDVIQNALNIAKGSYSDFWMAALYLVQGFANGIGANTFLAEAKAREMAAAAARAARQELDEHSPSKIAYAIGDFFGIAFVNALAEYAKKSYQAGAEIAKSAKNGLGDIISQISTLFDQNMDTQPVIRPVLDLSNVEKNTSRLNSALSRNYTYSINVTRAQNSRDASEFERQIGGNNYQFIQNNYSPKALSRLDIYRQTNNQFSALKRMVNAK